ncbi:aminotransferase class I/II-fold pyridoxal phosphate-dependent enzyme [bacterium]|nr:aminotransferase class I/II-fold pyridoxal phosphate-dependent enzyme [bacterium]
MPQNDDSSPSSSDFILTRRGFLASAGAAALSFVYLPGIGPVQAKPYPTDRTDDYEGRLCYNENPLGPSPMALAAMQDAATLGHRYPDWNSTTLEGQIAAYHGLSASNICAGAGATEIIHLLAGAFLGPGDEVITAYPSYDQIESEAMARGASVVRVPLKENHAIGLYHFTAAITPNTKMMYMVNPNNPTGTIFDRLEMQDFMATLPPDILVVVDEAYHDYVESTDYESCIPYVEEGKSMVVIRTFSKAQGLAGVRVGYAVASASRIGLIAAEQPYAMVSRIGQAAAAAAMDDTQHVADTVDLNNWTKLQLQTGIIGLGLNYIGHHTNFLMIDVGVDANAVRVELLARGYQVRSGWGMPTYLRVSTGTEAEIAGFLLALEDILSVGVDEGSAPVFAMSDVYPNPFNGRCTIPISVTEEAPVNLAIYDTQGRKVRSLASGPMDAGKHDLVWDGKNHLGRTVASGTYFANLIQGEFATSKKLIFVK